MPPMPGPLVRTAYDQEWDLTGMSTPTSAVREDRHTCRGEKARSGTACNPLFLTVHNVVIAFAHSRRLNVGNIAARTGL